jgi:hypothetical protein
MMAACMPAPLTPGHVLGCCWPVALAPAQLAALHDEAVHVTQPLLGAGAVLHCATVHNDAAIVRDSPAEGCTSKWTNRDVCVTWYADTERPV